MKVEVVNKPVYHLSLNSEEKQSLLTVQKIFEALGELDDKHQIWNELAYAFNGEPDSLIKIDGWEYLVVIIDNIIDLG